MCIKYRILGIGEAKMYTGVMLNIVPTEKQNTNISFSQMENGHLSSKMNKHRKLRGNLSVKKKIKHVVRVTSLNHRMMMSEKNRTENITLFTDFIIKRI